MLQLVVKVLTLEGVVVLNFIENVTMMSIATTT